MTEEQSGYWVSVRDDGSAVQLHLTDFMKPEVSIYLNFSPTEARELAAKLTRMSIKVEQRGES